MEAPVLPKGIYRFGLFELDPDNGRLLRRGVSVRIHDQPLRLLCRLLERPGQIVTREELCQSLWPEGTYVDFDGSLNAALKKLRSALGDDAENPTFIETVPKRGYRFIAPVDYDRPVEKIAAGTETTIPVSAVPGLLDNDRTASPDARFHWQTIGMVAGAALLLFLGAWAYRWKENPKSPAPRNVIAVLPFSNEGAGPDFDYLRYAIANDLVSDLSYAQSINVRPFASTSKYAAQPTDPVAAGKELQVSHVLAGGFLRDQQNLRVNLELIDVALNRTVWHDELTVPSHELIPLHDKLAISASQRLVPAMSVAAVSLDKVPAPRNEQAFELFMHSLVISLDPGPNQDAIHTLEQSLSLDSTYVPAWSQLSWRYYIDYHYGSGGEAALEKALQATRHLSELDPSSPPNSTTIRTEQGELNVAYEQAAAYLRRRPDFSMAHFWMGYVLRYAGVLDQAGKECDAALAIDPGFNVLRTCATAFILQGDYAHAQKYINVAQDPGFEALLRMHIALRARNVAEVLAEANSVAQMGYHNMDAKLAHLCLSHPSDSELAKAVADVESDPVASRDHELLYENADALAFCGQPDAALRQLNRAIKGNYCSYPAIDKDPLFDSIRPRPEFAELRQAGIQCQQNFLAAAKKSGLP